MFRLSSLLQTKKTLLRKIAALYQSTRCHKPGDHNIDLHIISLFSFPRATKFFGKIKVVLVSKQHVMEMYKGHGGKGPHIPDLEVVSFMLSSLCPSIYCIAEDVPE
jgi:hypothetical protein